MRVFQNPIEAWLEIKRDLAKSPEILSGRVQHMVDRTDFVREAMNYSYTIMEFPDQLDTYLTEAIEVGALGETMASRLKVWIPIERQARLFWEPGLISEVQHPALKQLLEGREPSYTYTDRLRGAADALVHHLMVAPESRRAYWPIFIPEDAVRSSRATRIPCSLGYQASLRPDPHNSENKTLHLTYLMRSCDFGTFWWSDIWLAREFQKYLYQELSDRAALEGTLYGVTLGHFSHIILSLHSFIDGEVY